MAEDDDRSTPEPAFAQATVKVVGPCKAGKSTLVAGLRRLGYAARVCAQEHSHTPAMWQRIAPADWLIYLEVSLDAVRARSPRGDWSEAILEEQRRRLAHARSHAHLIIDTDRLGPDAVLAQVVGFLAAHDVQPLHAPAGDGI